jgi:drug/metabolite transporter (DMT)-like permease
MILLAVLEYAILASTFTLAKVAINHADPLFIIGVRMVASAPLMFLVHFLQKKNSFIIHKPDRFKFFLASIFHIFLPFIGEFWALQFVSSAKTAITYSLTPFIAAVLSYFLLKKKLTQWQSIGLIIGLLGLMPIFFSPDDIPFIAGEFMFVSVPEIVLLFAVISSSYAWFIVSDLMKKGYGISLINGVAMFLGGIFSLILWYLVSGDQDPVHGDLNQFILWTSLLIVVANVISYNFYGWLLNHISITFMSAIGFLCPIFASIYGIVLLNENLGLSHLLALVMVTFGLWLFYREEMRKAHE